MSQRPPRAQLRALAPMAAGIQPALRALQGWQLACAATERPHSHAEITRVLTQVMSSRGAREGVRSIAVLGSTLSF